MRKKGTSRFKRQRRLMIELPGLGKPGALERRPYPPGDHGMKRKKFSEYSLRLEEKQKVLFHYGLREKQLRRFIHQAKKGSSTNWTDKLIGMLERRLDNVVFRLNFAPSIAAAKQLISHGHVQVNGKKLSISSALLKVGDTIELSAKTYENQVYLFAKQNPRLELAHFLQKQESAGKEAGQLITAPCLTDIPFPFQPNYFTEYYSRRS